VGRGDVALTVTEARPRPAPTTSTPALVPPGWWFGAVPVVFLAVFLAWPLATVLSQAWSPDGVGVLASPSTWQVVGFTLVQATLSTALTLAVGLPAAYALHRLRVPGRGVALALLTVPFVLPTVVVGAAFRALLPEQLVGGLAAIVIAHVFFNVAVVVRVVGGLLAHLDPRYAEAAASLGAGPWRVLRTVTWPLVRPAVLAAAALVFLFSFTSFGVVLILGGPTARTLEVEIYLRTVAFFDLPAAAVLAVLQLVSVGVVLLVGARVQRRLDVEQRLTSRAVPRGGSSPAGRVLVGWTWVLALLMAAPLVALVRDSLRVGERWGLDWWVAAFSDGPRTRDVPATEALVTTLSYAAVATVLAVLVGGAVACALAYARRGHTLLDTAAMLPLGTSAVTLGFGLLVTFDVAPVDLRGSWILVPVAQALVAVPLVLRTVLPVLRAVDPRLREVAATLGSPPTAVWRHVDLPVLGRALAAAAGLAAAVSIGEFGATSFLARADAVTLPVLVGRLLSRPGEEGVGVASVLSVLLVVVTGAVLLGTERWRRAGSPW
jgi:thiamine transport system permease protein